MSRDKGRFQKGQSGNPSGRPRANPLLRAVKETSYAEFLLGLQKYGKLTRDEMQAELQRSDLTMFELLFGQIVDSAARGDKDARQLLLDRLWGKVKEEVRLQTVIDPREQEIARMTTEQQLKLAGTTDEDEETKF